MFDLCASHGDLASALAIRRQASFTPPSQLTPDEWADEYRVVPSETSAITGKWDTSQFEVARGAMQALVEPGVRKATICASAQIMKTSAAETAIAYFMDTAPCPILVYQPTDDTAATFVDTKLDPMIKHSPKLAAKWGGKRKLELKRDDYTTFFKKFPGGYVEIMTAQAVANLGMRSAKIVIFDEVDKFKVTKDGDVIALGEERTKGFSGEELSIRVSTPTVEGASPIMSEYRKSDMRKPYVACPHCGEYHYLKWSNVQYKDENGKADPALAAYYCETCGVAWSEAQRVTAMTTRGSISWRQTRAFRCCDEHQEPEQERIWDSSGRALCKHCGERAVSNEHAGFWAWEIYHPRRSLSDTVKVWLNCQGNPAKLQNFINSKLAETWKPQDDDQIEVDPDQFAARTEPDWDAIPEQVRIITMGVDVQPRGSKSPGRLEAEVVGWGDGEETWSLDYHILEGDPDEADVWVRLDEIRTQVYQTADGRSLHVQACCVDTGGHNTDSVMSYAGARRSQRVWPIKGASETSGRRQTIWPEQPPKTIKHGAKLYVIGTLAAKDWVNACVGRSQAGPQFMHVPSGRAASWFEQVLNEKRVTFMANGRSATTWRPRYSGARTEGLDCRVYAKAALEGLKRLAPSLVRLSAVAAAKPADTQLTDTHSDAPAAQNTDNSPSAMSAPRRRRKKIVRTPAPSSSRPW